jgi:hypothetical protein
MGGPPQPAPMARPPIDSESLTQPGGATLGLQSSLALPGATTTGAQRPGTLPWPHMVTGPGLPSHHRRAGRFPGSRPPLPGPRGKPGDGTPTPPGINMSRPEIFRKLQPG